MPVTPLMAFTFLMSVSASVQMRVGRALRAETQHKRLLQAEVQRQRSELEALHERESARSREQAISDERARIVREMHDGLGSQLVGLLSTVESGQYTQSDLANEVQEAMGHLRLTIDNLDPLADDLSSLLGQIRFRLDGRLRKAGLRLVWRVEALPVLEQVSAADLGHLQKLLFEAFTNVIKHAAATEVRVSASLHQLRQSIDIRIQDNGLGFRAGDAPLGRGMHNMHHRAAQIGAILRVRAEPGMGTEVHIEWPLISMGSDV